MVLGDLLVAPATRGADRLYALAYFVALLDSCCVRIGTTKIGGWRAMSAVEAVARLVQRYQG